MNPKLKEKILESLAAVLPITLIVMALSVILVPMDVGTSVMFTVGAVLLVFGMGLFQLGAEIAMTPLGEGIGVEMERVKRIPVIVGIAFLMGVIITIAEPDLQVLAQQVPSVPNKVLIYAVAVGVGVFLALAVLRILKRISLSRLLLALYGLLAIISIFVPKDFLSIAYDAGGVTTGPITVPFIMAMGVGMAAVRGDKDAANDSFGLVALSSIGPILAVALLGCFYNPQNTVYTATEVPQVITTQDVAREFMHGLPHYILEVAMSILPIVAVFVIFQLATHRYQKRQRTRILVGFAYTYVGLVLFLCGVNVGFGPVGTVLGRELARSHKWLLVPIGMLIGFFIVKAEPAIQVLNRQIQGVTNGAISAKAMNRCLSIGVAVSVGLAMLRVVTGLPIQYILIPGYVLALTMSFIVPPIFVGIAFDSGGVASGPMTTTFLLPLSIGACETMGGNVMSDAFGVVALVALTPLIAVQIMGVMYRIKTNRAKKVVVPAFDGRDDIIEFEEGV